MSVGKKVGAVALGTASVAGWLVTNLIKEGFNAAAKKVGNGGYTDSKGRMYTRKDYKEAAEKCNRGEDIFAKGFKGAVKLWKDKD
ncbi:MAG: hypothetical protein IJS01_12170 [Lentisphaeria bacterium]|nr:hypothetical protein [Lentisphaeria bacterium]